jgi:DNA-binding response OmpR family regulator
MTFAFDHDHKETILIVDSDLQRKKTIEQLLKDSNYRVATSSSCQEAFSIIHGVQPDLILCNLQLISSEGYQALKAFKQNGHVKQVPLIVIIENTDDDTLKMAFRSGAADYVRHPVSKIELLARAKAALIQQQLLNKQLIESRAKQQLEQAGVLCHELNQPMQAVMGFSQLMLMDKLMKDSPHLKQANNIYQQVERMGEIIKRLMGVTRLNSQRYMVGAKTESY